MPIKPNRIISSLTACGLAFIAAGCAAIKSGSFQPYGGGQAKLVPLTTYDQNASRADTRMAAWAYYDAKYRASHMITDQDGHPLILSEAPPDVATSIERMLSLSASYKDQGSLGLSNFLHAAVEKLAARTATVELLRDGGYILRELAFNNRLSGGVTNIVTMVSNGIPHTTCTTVQGAADRRLQQLFSVIQAVETSPQPEQTERAKAVSLYLQSCLSSNRPVDTNIIILLQGATPISCPSPTDQPAKTK